MEVVGEKERFWLERKIQKVICIGGWVQISWVSSLK